MARLGNHALSLRVVHVVGSIDDEAAGPSVSVPRLAEAQARAGLNVELAAVATGEPPAHNLAPSVRQRRYEWSLSRVPIVARLLASGPMKRDLLRRASGIDIAHTHGIWLLPNVYPAAMTREGTHFVLSPRGMLGAQALVFSRTKKWAFHELLQKRALARASLLHATCEAEVDDIRAFGLTAPVVMAPNGVDIPSVADLPRRAKSRTILSLGRVHPKKGLDRLIRAFAAVQNDILGWHLRIIGPSELGYGAALQKLAGELGVTSISFEPAVFGDAKLAAYRDASIFVLPSLHENFAMTVAEALSAGTPVISAKGAPWAGLNIERCGMWIDHGPKAMEAALRSMMQLSDAERNEMGARGRAWMSRDFSWDSMARTIIDAYSWLLDGGPPPPSIRFADTASA